MGEAKRRTLLQRQADQVTAAWAAGLDQRDQTVLRIADRLGKVLTMPGACYRCTMFLAYHLDVRHDIKGEAVVGYANDGTDEAFCYHAWYELDGRMTDIALCRPQEPSVQRRGAVTILGRETVPGWAYTYHRERPPEATAMVMQFMRDPEMREVMTEQENVHLRMIATANKPDLMRAYLDGAPDGLDYEAIAAAVGR